MANIVDQYSGLDHKAGMGDNDGGDFDIATFYNARQIRRLKAYEILRSMVEATSRRFVIPPPNVDEEEFKLEWREFGDPAVLTERIAAGVLGDSPMVGVVDADGAVPERPLIPDPPEDPATTNTDSGNVNEAKAQFETQIYATLLSLWQENAQSVVDQWIAEVEAVPERQARQDWLQDWAVADEFIAKLHEAETEWTVPLGDSVMVFGWNPDTGRPESEIFAPDTYMPVLDDARPSEFPKKVHLVWSYPGKDDQGEDKDFVRRLTWELVSMVGEDVESGVDFGQPPAYLEEGQEQTEACLFSDATFEKSDFKSVDDPDGENGTAVFALLPDPTSDNAEALLPADRVPLNLDFIPLVHFPNTLSKSGRHFGRSPLIRLSQLFDEVNGVDTDESLASQWAARPPVAMSGLGPKTETLDLSAGQAIALKDNGRVFTIDMAKNLGEIGQRLKALLRRMSVNAQVPEGLLGRVDASDVPSGIAFTLSFTAFEQLIERLRMARSSKCSLALKMVQRIAIQYGSETVGDTRVFPAEVRFGPFMPQDLLGVAQIIKILWDAKAISQETALGMAQEAGINMGNLDSQLASIRGSAMMDDAAQLFDATGSTRAVFDFLGIPFMEPEEAVDPDGDPGSIALESATAEANGSVADDPVGASA